MHVFPYLRGHWSDVLYIRFLQQLRSISKCFVRIDVNKPLGIGSSIELLGFLEDLRVMGSGKKLLYPAVPGVM